jgi:hypothetical protein
LQSPPTGKLLTSNPWPPLTAQVSSVTTYQKTPNYFNVDLANSKTQKTSYDNANDRHTLGSLNSSVDFPQLNTGTNPYFGEPTNPFPWVSWNNRPFSNPMELLCVPSSSPSRACFEMTPGYPPSNPAAVTAGNPYDYSTANPTSNPFVLHQPFGQQNGQQTGFGQLLNFFQTAPVTPSAAASTAPHLYRLLDFVEVPSPYSGAERWYNPQQNFGGFTAPPAVSGYYRPPFNKLSRFRDPGKINLNTVFDDPNATGQTESVWDALVGQFPGLRRGDGFFQQLLLSRQGYTSASYGTAAYGINNSYPTRFANPIRPADSADLMPNSTYAPGMRKVTPVEASLLRPDTNSLAGGWQPLFQINQTTSGTNGSAYQSWIGPAPGQPAGTNVGQYHDIIRNPYFRFQALQKLGNMTTNHSNCFAVWVTIGYFEVEDYRPGGAGTAIVVDAAHPDGLSLSQEVGADSGEITRHRAFYIIDRSIPVGFLPGSRLNTDDCVLVRRLIE